MFHVKHLSFEVSKYQNGFSEMFHVKQNHTFFKTKHQTFHVEQLYYFKLYINLCFTWNTIIIKLKSGLITVPRETLQFSHPLLNA